MATPTLQSRIKFDVYTLACHLLVQRLTSLEHATEEGIKGVSYEHCINVFNGVLERFLKGAHPQDPHAAASELADMLRADTNLYRGFNAKAADTFVELADQLALHAGVWSHQDALEQLHRQGETLGREFFSTSPWEETQRRLACTCSLQFEYGPVHRDDRVASLADPFGYPQAPVSYYSQYICEDGNTLTHQIVVRLTPAADFWLYVAYPFLFLHEYTAHVYATGSNESFNDGWMLYAAAVFLKKNWMSNGPHGGMHRDQADVFYEKLYHKIGNIPRQACRFTREFYAWLLMCDPDGSIFRQLTFELASINPAGERTWASRFINQLKRQFVHDRDSLYKAICSCTSVRELMRAMERG